MFLMGFLNRSLLMTFLVGAGSLFPLASRADLWRTAYYAGYSSATLPVSDIDFTALTHIVHFSLLPNGDGTLNPSTNAITPQGTAELVSGAHAANKQVLICIGGAGSYFPNAASTANVASFVSNLTNFMASGGYDGIDVDWEPLPDGDGLLYTNLIFKLRAALDGFSTHKLLISAVPPSVSPGIVGAVQDKLDQINLMTYDLSGPYAGWVTWFNSPIYDSGYVFPSVTNELVPSIEGSVNQFVTSGIPANKLGIGLAFYGYVWYGGFDGTSDGMRTPRESWTIAPTNYTRTYNQIVSSNFSANQFYYDAIAQAAWIGVDGGGTNDMFISYDDARACQSKVSYARNRGLGGLILWEITQDHTPGQPDPLLQAVKQALATPGTLAIQPAGQNMNLSFTSAPLGSYRVQWNTNLAGNTWNSLLVTNLSLTVTGGVIQVTDPGFADKPLRFYRVQTPP
jgi:chitinase